MQLSKSPSLWLILWLTNSIAVILMNKWVFEKADLKYPLFLTFVHLLCNTVGCTIFFSFVESSPNAAVPHRRFVSSIFGRVTRNKLNVSGWTTVFVFSVVFSLNIGIGNVSLRYVGVTFNQTMHSLVPTITIIMGCVLGKKISKRRVISVIPVAIGVTLAYLGDMSHTALGLMYTILSIFLQALKVVAAGEMLTGNLKFHPLDLLSLLSPLSMIQCLMLSHFAGETSSIASRWHDELHPLVNFYPMCIVLLSGIISFLLNISALMAIKLTSPLTLCIAASVRQILMLTLSTFMFGNIITLMNGTGIALVFIGSACYSYMSVIEKRLEVSENNFDNTSKPSIAGGDVDPDTSYLDEELMNLIEMQQRKVGTL